MQYQIPTIKITTKGEMHYISRSVDLPGLKQQQQSNNNQNDMAIEETEEQWRQEERNHDNERYYQDENWKLAKTNKKPLRNFFSSLTEEIDADPTSKATTHSSHITIFVEAQIIDPVIELITT
ncbi:uncharacterized protein LOC122572810 [Bombus pyrosoma]|uniref:uncharacterized protein LOC122572810 n=1 Tax=Bombus pyrosoma TaxID=396416 RepID=UPI001CB8CF64|nr:uncharacterized protein LOC122572810 [Bombus pyrosoma]